jgi:hypothetical protein
LDENKRAIAVSSSDRYRYDIKAAPVDESGAVSSPLKGELVIHYDKDIANDLKKAKHLIVKVRATGATPSSRIKITDANGMEVKVELRAEGGVDINMNEI